MVAGRQVGHDQRQNRRHAAGGGDGGLGAFQRRQALWKALTVGLVKRE